MPMDGMTGSPGGAVTFADPGLGYPADLSGAVAAARDGDEEAFRVLYRAVQPGLLRYLYALVGDDAEEVTSETWQQIAQDLRSYREEGIGFRAWAVSIARQRAMDRLRRHHRRPTVAAPADEFLPLMGPDTQAIDAVSTRAAIDWIVTLPREQAEAILLRVVVGLDAESTAHVLGKRVGAVRTAAYRGLRTLAEHLDRQRTTGPFLGDPPPDSGSDRPG
jgi:RNA polymerase sigma-70 factor, ECF subfamily